MSDGNWEDDLQYQGPARTPNPHYFCGTVNSPECPTSEHPIPTEYEVKGYRRPREFVARFRTVKAAKEFLDNVDRVCAVVESGKATRAGREVTFSAYTFDPNGYHLVGDIELSAGYYGGSGTYLNGHRCLHEY